MSQDLTISQIKAEVEKIDQDLNLKRVNFDANEVYDLTTDGGGTFEIWLAGNEIRKITQNIFLSNGLFITTLYLQNGQPILISETEKHFEWNEDFSSLDYGKDLETAYQEWIYTSHWDKDPLKVETKGESLSTEAICGISDYWGMVDTARRVLGENPSGNKN